jgi:lipopolysaccharide biosynthesis protein
LFAHYDPAGRVAPHVLRYVAHLAECGFVVHVACSGLAQLSPHDETALRQTGAMPHLRPNGGLDFGAWRDLMLAGCAEGAEEVLLANDSVFGPFADLRPRFAAMRARGLDAWGMVESEQGAWHLQSWFLCITGAALARPAVRRVFEQPFAAMSKPEIVLHGELGLGAALRAEGLACGAVFAEQRRNRLRWLVRSNPMHLHWASMIEREGVPFLKVELLRDNPMRIFWADQWPEVIRRASTYPTELISRHLGSAKPSPPPPWRTMLIYLCLTRDRAEALRAIRRYGMALATGPRR